MEQFWIQKNVFLDFFFILARCRLLWTCSMMSLGPPIQDMSFGLILPFARRAPSPDLLVNSCVSLPNSPVTYFYPAQVTFLPSNERVVVVGCD